MAERCRKSFQYFLEEWRDEGDHPKYLEPARELLKPERDTLQVSMTDIETYNSNLVEAIVKNFYRLTPHLCVAVKNFVVDHDHMDDIFSGKEIYLCLTDMEIRLKSFINQIKFLLT